VGEGRLLERPGTRGGSRSRAKRYPRDNSLYGRTAEGGVTGTGPRCRLKLSPLAEEPSRVGTVRPVEAYVSWVNIRESEVRFDLPQNRERESP